MVEKQYSNNYWRYYVIEFSLFLRSDRRSISPKFNLKVHKREKFFVSDFEFFIIL